VSDLFGLAARERLDRLQIADPWRRNVDVSLGLIDDLELQIARLTVELNKRGADHRYIPLLVTAPRFGWINAFTVASEIGDIERFASPAKPCGYTGLCPRVIQSGNSDRRGPTSKHGPRYLRRGLFEATLNARQHPLYKQRYQHTKRRLGRQRGPKAAQIDLSRKLTEAIWHMLTRNEPFAPAGAHSRLATRRLSSKCAATTSLPLRLIPTPLGRYRHQRRSPPPHHPRTLSAQLPTHLTIRPPSYRRQAAAASPGPGLPCAAVAMAALAAAAGGSWSRTLPVGRGAASRRRRPAC
jgi:hypothetical protein